MFGFLFLILRSLKRIGFINLRLARMPYQIICQPREAYLKIFSIATLQDKDLAIRTSCDHKLSCEKGRVSHAGTNRTFRSASTESPLPIDIPLMIQEPIKEQL